MAALDPGQYTCQPFTGLSLTARLFTEPGDHVLDLCCAPGAKLCMIGSIMQHKYLQRLQSDTRQVSNTDGTNGLREHSGSVTGVDIAAHRLAAAKYAHVILHMVLTFVQNTGQKISRAQCATIRSGCHHI